MRRVPDAVIMARSGSLGCCRESAYRRTYPAPTCDGPRLVKNRPWAACPGGDLGRRTLCFQRVGTRPQFGLLPGHPKGDRRAVALTIQFRRGWRIKVARDRPLPRTSKPHPSEKRSGPTRVSVIRGRARPYRFGTANPREPRPSATSWIQRLRTPITLFG
jgi:hypothetical protein